MSGGKDDKVRQTQKQLRKLRQQIDELEALFLEEEPEKKITKTTEEWQPRWYHSRWLEPVLGVVLAVILLVSLNSFLGIALTGFLRSVENKLVGEDIPSAKAAGNSFLYANNCGRCHGASGEKTKSGETLRQFVLTRGETATSRVIREGQGSMPAFGRSQGGTLSDEEIISTISWIRANGIDQTSSRSLVGQQPDLGTSSSMTLAGVQGHENDWKPQHAGKVKETGANTCYKCHNSQFCILCHTSAGNK